MAAEDARDGMQVVQKPAWTETQTLSFLDHSMHLGSLRRWVTAFEHATEWQADGEPIARRCYIKNTVPAYVEVPQEFMTV